MYAETTKEKLDVLLAAASGLQMVSVVSQNTDAELDKLDAYAVELLTTADDELAATLRQRLHLLHSMRDEQAEVLYAGFKKAETHQQLETFVFDMDDISIQRLDRVVHKRILGEPKDMGRILTERLHKIHDMRQQLQPIRDGIFRFLAADTLEEAETILLEDAHVLLTEEAGQEILQSNSRDRTLRQRLDARKKLWRKVYGQQNGKTITGSVYKLDKEAEEKSEPEAQAEVPTMPPPTIEFDRLGATQISENSAETDVSEADRLMNEVYDLLDQAIGNAMVAFSIYRKSDPQRADEALKLLTELHNETKSGKSE